jgi:hypothetical protein
LRRGAFVRHAPMMRDAGVNYKNYTIFDCLRTTSSRWRLAIAGYFMTFA